MPLASDGFVAPSKMKDFSRFAKEHPIGKKLFEILEKEVMMVFERQVELFEKDVKARLDDIGGSVTRVEGELASVVAHHEMVAAGSHARALEAIDVERREKKVLCQWLNGFLAASSHELRLDPIDFAFARFSLNMAVSAGDTPVQKMLEARVPSFLVGQLSSDNDVVLGPAAIALAHLALHEAARVPIMDSGAVAPLVLQARRCRSPAVLAQLCKVMGCLALQPENRQRVAGEGGMQALCELIGEATEFADFPRCTNGVRSNAMAAMVNFMYQSDANRKLLVELKGVAPIVDAAVNSPDSAVVEQAVRCLGNVSFNQPYTASMVVASRGVDSICGALEASDLTQDEAIFEAGTIALANLCNSEQNQTAVGASPACAKLAVHVCAHAPSPHVILGGFRLVAALSFASFTNKTRLGELGCLNVCLQTLRRYGFLEPSRAEPFYPGLDWCCKALASLLLHRGNQVTFRDCWGLQLIVDLCLETESLDVLYSSAMCVAAVVPPAEARFEAHDEGRSIQVDECRSFDALNRARNVLFGQTDGGPPPWLETAWETMGMDDSELAQAKAAASEGGERMDPGFKEFISRLDLFEERSSPVFADRHLATSQDLRSLIFATY